MTTATQSPTNASTTPEVTEHGEHRAPPHYDDLNISAIVGVGIISAILTYACIAFVQGLVHHWEFLQVKKKIYSSATTTPYQLKLDQQRELLTSYLQDPNGKIAIPVDQAMAKVVAELQESQLKPSSSTEGAHGNSTEHSKDSAAADHGTATTETKPATTTEPATPANDSAPTGQAVPATDKGTTQPEPVVNPETGKGE
jgi:hypothetical protein